MPNSSGGWRTMPCPPPQQPARTTITSTVRFTTENPLKEAISTATTSIIPSISLSLFQPFYTKRKLKEEIRCEHKSYGCESKEGLKWGILMGHGSHFDDMAVFEAKMDKFRRLRWRAFLLHHSLFCHFPKYSATHSLKIRIFIQSFTHLFYILTPFIFLCILHLLFNL